MESRWSEADAQQLVERYAHEGVAADLAMLVYSTRLLGGDPQLVLHGGGNTSVKTRVRDLVGEEIEVMCVKGSGWDMATIEPAGLPAVRLAPLRSLRSRLTLSDEAMVRIQRAACIDPAAPNPSVEALLHAFLPHKFIAHSHATAVLSLTNQPNGEDLARAVYRDRFGLVPYTMPGVALARKATDIYEELPEVEGLILIKHGVFTFGASAREAYQRMIDVVCLAQARLARSRKPVFVAGRMPPRAPALSAIAPMVRGACSLPDLQHPGAYRRFILDFRAGAGVLKFVNGAELARYGQAGVVTPDHTIRTKNWPMLVAAPEAGKLGEFKVAINASAKAYIAAYEAYFARHNTSATKPKRMLDPMARVVLVPGVGLFGLGLTKKDAQVVADLAESAIETIADAEAIGRFESINERDMFDMEYWSLEQAKLGQQPAQPLTGQIAVITGGAGVIGSATAQAFAAAGAEIALLDIDGHGVGVSAKTIGGAALAIECDVTDLEAVRTAFEKVIETFGGVDIVVSNAGAAWQGRIGEVDEAVLRQSFELNFFAHQSIAQTAVRAMLAQDNGGVLLFNVSKQAINPGPNFGPYGLPKAATLLLVRQYALEYGGAGIRANAVNADRVRSGLLTPDLIAARAKSRGVSENEYLTGNLLGREVGAEDVAQAFLHSALALKTTGNVTTVDGGNIAAALR
jgi:rhamnose utilization protein RhaD (predicted bifunctional aldolase and dehydrogenase)/NAD(P)-dependent dehydrogenase (short-subunit alcohol dehydrogenase family)